jgi:hypothetical protein
MTGMLEAWEPEGLRGKGYFVLGSTLGLIAETRSHDYDSDG